MGEEEAEERKGVVAGQVEQENTNHGPMEEVVEFECLQAGKQLRAAPKAKTTIPRPTGKQHKNPNARTQNPNA